MASSRRVKNPAIWGAVAVASFVVSGLGRAEDLRIDLDRPGATKDGVALTDGDPEAGVRAKLPGGEIRIRPRIDASGFAIHVEASGYLQRLEPTTIHVDSQQKGQWADVKLEAGRYLNRDWDPDDPREMRLDGTLKFDLDAGERKYVQERDWIQREAQQRSGGRDAAAALKARQQLLIERINAIRNENIQAGADRRGKATAHLPPLPRQGFSYEKPETLERLLKEQCGWESVAEVFKATAFAPPDEKEFPDFAASQIMASEIQQALMGMKVTARVLGDNQYHALAAGNHYKFSARFIPELPNAAADTLWKSAPAVRLADGIVKRATLEGKLDRTRGHVVAWWRVQCQSPRKIQSMMAKGDGDCFWTWVETPDEHVQYVRLLLHSPNSPYRLSLTLAGATKGEDVSLFDGPFNPPAKAPY